MSLLQAKEPNLKQRFVEKLETFSCRRAALIASEGLNRKLAWWEKASLWVHRSICPATRRYQSQMRFIEDLRLELLEENSSSQSTESKLPEEFRAQIAQHLKAIQS